MQSRLAELRYRTRLFDGPAWDRLRQEVGITEPLATFDELATLVVFELDVDGVTFPVRTERGRVIRYGRGAGPRINEGELARGLPRNTSDDASAAFTRNARINAILAAEAQRADAMGRAARAAVVGLEKTTRSAAESIGAARDALAAAVRRETDARISLNEAQEHYAAARESIAACDAAVVAARKRAALGNGLAAEAAVSAALATLEVATVRLTSLEETVRGRADAAETYRCRSANIRKSIASTLAQLEKAQATAASYLDDAQVELEWLRVAQCARDLRVEVACVRKRAHVRNFWHLTPRQEHPEKAALGGRIGRQLVLGNRVIPTEETVGIPK